MKNYGSYLVKSDKFSGRFDCKVVKVKADFEGSLDDSGVDLLPHVKSKKMRDFFENDMPLILKYADSDEALKNLAHAKLMKLGYIEKTKTDSEIDEILKILKDRDPNTGNRVLRCGRTF